MNLIIKKIKRRLNRSKNDVFSWFQQKRQPSSAFFSLLEAYHIGTKPPKVLLLGDSVSERVSWNDYDDRTLADMIIYNLKKQTDVAAISYGGFTLDVFYYLVLALEKMKNKPELVVMPINMRNFSPQWDLEPTWQFKHEIDQIQSFIADTSIFPSLEQLEKNEIPSEIFNAFDATHVNFSLSPLDSIAQFRLLVNANPTTEEQRRFRLQQIFIFHYTNKLVRGHRKLTALENILKLLQEKQIPFFVYITPLNVDAGMRLVGAEFSKALHENVSVVSNLVSEYLTNEKSVFMDWSELMRSECFFHADNATEHLNESGRKILAESITSKISVLIGESVSRGM